MTTSIYSLFLLSVCAGAILPLAFAPHHLWPLAILSPAILLFIWQKPTLSPKGAFFTGLSYGLALFSMGISWVFISIHEFGNTDIPLAIFITSLLIIALSLFIAVQGYCLKRFFCGSSLLFSLFGFPSAWVLFEWLRSWLFDGFPWLYLGYTQLETPLSGYAPLFSVYGVSLIVALSSSALILFFQETKKIKIIVISLMGVLWGIGFLLKQHAFTTPSDEKAYTVSLIQGNIKPFDKFRQAEPIRVTEQIYGRLTATEWGRDLILWPEGAIPIPLPYAEPYTQQLQNRALLHHSTLITGIQVINEKGEYYNALIALGNGKGTYFKHHLLPFGDFIPFERWLRGLIDFFDLPMSSFISGPKNQPLIHAGKLKLAPLVCYEIAFPELVRENLQDADAIVTLSEDGWFGNSWGPPQHLQIAQMRALETGRYVLRATTSGITAIIDPKGKIVSSIPQFTRTVLRGTFYSMEGKTLWSKIGFWPLFTLLMMLFILPGRLKKMK